MTETLTHPFTTATILAAMAEREAGQVLRDILLEDYLPPLTQVHQRPAVALSERTSAGLFGTTVSVAARRRNGKVLLDGVVRFVPLPAAAARLVVEVDNALFEVSFAQPGLRLETVPMDALDGLPFAAITLDGCVAAPSPVAIGDLAGAVARARLLVVAVALGLLERALTVTVAHASARRLFGAQLIELQSVRHRIATAGARSRMARAYLEAVPARPADAAKVAMLAAAVVTESVEDCSRFFGGRGLLTDYWISTAHRDARFLPVLLGREELLLDLVEAELESGRAR